MPELIVPAGYGEIEYVEKRSRFIGRVWRADSETEAMDKIREMREKHWDATHNVYAYSIKEGGIARFSDDGEPSGTSGMPTQQHVMTNKAEAVKHAAGRPAPQMETETGTLSIITVESD